MEATTRVTAALQRVKAPFLELPDTRLSVADAASISGIDHQLCGIVLNALVDGRFLTRLPDGAYRRTHAIDD